MLRKAREKCSTVSAKSWRRSISKAMRTCSRCGKLAAAISPRTKRSRSGQSAAIAVLPQPVGVLGAEVEPVNRFQRLHLAQRSGRERRLALEGVQHDALEQIAEGHVELGGECLQHLEQPALEAHAGLGAGYGLHGLYGTLVPRYQASAEESAPRAARRRCRLTRDDGAEPDRVQPGELFGPVGDIDSARLGRIAPALGPLQGAVIVRALHGEHDRRLAVGLLAGLHATATDDDLVGVVAVDLLWPGRRGAEAVGTVALNVRTHARQHR